MFTVAETETFARHADDYWDEAERMEFVAYISSHPEAGSVVPGSGGLRKVRWSVSGKGKRGGVRVIYYNMLSANTIWLLLIYGKIMKDNIPAHILRQVKKELEQ